MIVPVARCSRRTNHSQKIAGHRGQDNYYRHRSSLGPSKSGTNLSLVSQAVGEVKLEAEEKEKEQQREVEKLKLEAEEKEKEQQREVEKRKMEAEEKEKEFERQRELEKLRLEAEEKEKERQEREAERRHQREMRQLGLVREDRTETERVRAKAPKLPPFVDGKDQVDAYLQRFERFATANAWDPDTWASSLCALLTGRALEVFSRLDNTEAQDYKSVKEALMKRYNLTEEGFRAKFRQSKPEEGESAGQFLVRINSYLERWVELSDATKHYEDLRDMFVREQFMETCSPDLAVHLRERAPKDLKEMAQMAENFLMAHKRELSARGESTVRENPRYLPTGRRCFVCDSPEHLVKDCPRNRSEASTSPKSFYVGRKTPSSAFEVKGRVEGRQVPLLLDTGSTQTLIHADLVDPEKVKPSRRGKITCIHGDEKGYPDAEVEIDVGSKVYRVTAKVAPNLPRPAIIGRDIPNLARLILRYASGKLESSVTREVGTIGNWRKTSNDNGPELGRYGNKGKYGRGRRDGRGPAADFAERPKLRLAPRTKPGVSNPHQASANSQRSIFGDAKPVDTAAREREIEERLSRQKVGGKETASSRERLTRRCGRAVVG
ncbi:uncharacterized protein [Branchiostoma lanceolatum]|uniref:uncharacterized protein n=1 Tax=Branchiostoma lanceolatum TaxID=7740 RepID=UPI0034544155